MNSCLRFFSKVFSEKAGRALLLCLGLSACGGGGGSGFAPVAVAPQGAVAAAPPTAPADTTATSVPTPPSLEGIEYADIAGLTEKAAQGATSHDMVVYLLKRIESLDKQGPAINAVIELNPDALAIADQLDAERASGKSRGPLHGIPIFLKDNIDTGDKMQTTAGSLAMVGQPAAKDAFIAKRLRDAGALVLGKTNLSEWAHSRDYDIPSGWSGRGGQTLDPYVLDQDPCGSSTGSAVSVAAGFAPIAIGTETDGSIMCPSGANGIVGIRPTLGLASRTGVIPISSEQDTPGPMARTVRDAAIVLSAIAASDPLDAATVDAHAHAVDFTQFLTADGLRGKRIGYPSNAAPSFDKTLAAMRAAGATLVPVTMPNPDYSQEETLQETFFGKELNAYLVTRIGLPIKNITELQAFNLTAPLKADGTSYPQKQIDGAVRSLTQALLPDPVQAARQQKDGARNGIDTVLKSDKLDALVYLDDDGYGGPMAGYPSITVPNGVGDDGYPVPVYFLGTQWNEPTLLSIAYGFEQATKGRRNPQFLKTLLTH